MLYTSIVAERIGLRRSFAVIMAMSFALNFILALALLLQQPETRTIVVPPTLAAEREVWTFDEAGPGAPYLERWALSVLSHAASVTPETVDSSRRVVLQHVDPGFYGKLEEALIVEADRIKKDHSSTIFYPDRALFMPCLRKYRSASSPFSSTLKLYCSVIDHPVLLRLSGEPLKEIDSNLAFYRE